MKPPRDCPCHSGLRYAACCGPYHSGTREAETPEALMRSRYSAFALGLGDYLVRTLAERHPDRALPERELARELSRQRDRMKYLGLTIVHAATEGDRGEVLFFARLFERGQNRSFAELSQFVREAGAWRYASGVLVPAAELPADPSALTREAFARIAGIAD